MFMICQKRTCFQSQKRIRRLEQYSSPSKYKISWQCETLGYQVYFIRPVFCYYSGIKRTVSSTVVILGLSDYTTSFGFQVVV